MNVLAVGVASLALASTLAAQAPGHWPPDSLINTKVIPHDTPVMQVVGTMRDFAGALGVRCHFCHAGADTLPLAETDFAKDERRTKLVARQMMRMVAEINGRLDTIPDRPTPGLQVTCRTCHRGISRPVPLSLVMVDTATALGADTAISVYRALRAKYFGRDAYDFGEPSLNTAAFRLGRAGKFDDALALLGLNEGFFPGSSNMYVVRGNIQLMRGDTSAAAVAFREAVRRDSTNGEARGRLRDIGQQP
jgi:photosynthetic reaction center cytochrome c subunit